MAKLNLQKKKFIDEESLAKIVKIGISFGEKLNVLEQKCITPYDDSGDTNYVAGEYVTHDGYLWEVKVATSGAWNESRFEKLCDDLSLITKSDIESMLGLTTDELQTLASIILDSEVRLDKTWSSSKIYSDIQQCLNDGKTFTLQQFAKANKASYHVVSATSEMTDKSVIYLLQNNTNYDMYIVEADGTPVKIGDTTIDLSQFYTKTEIDNDFVKKTDADGKYALITTVDKKAEKTDLDNHINDTVAHMTQSEKDSYALKSSITDTIDSTSTSTDIASAKGVYDNVIKNNNIKTYYLLSQLSVTTPCTIKDIWDKMPVNSMGIFDVDSSMVTDLDVFVTALKIKDADIYGFLTIGKFAKRTILEFRRSHTDSAIEPEIFIGYCIGKNCTSIQWKKMILSSIEGASAVTTITLSDTTNYKQHSGIELKYYTLDGVCYISGGIDCVKPSSDLKYLAKLSKPKLGYSYAKGIVVNNSASDTSHLTMYIDGSGSLGLQNGLAGGSYRFNFSYPIA